MGRKQVVYSIILDLEACQQTGLKTHPQNNSYYRVLPTAMVPFYLFGVNGMNTVKVYLLNNLSTNYAEQANRGKQRHKPNKF